MADTQLAALARRLHRLVRPPVGGGQTDAQLLERFVACRDEAAFEVLVWRHGVMVLGVCRRVLRQEQDAEDAFQATFLALARKAGAIGRCAALGGWLYKVAFRVALQAKAEAAKRARRERPGLDLAGAAVAREPADEADWRDLRPVLDEEVTRLPEKYRVPVVLCYLEGKAYEEAARQLGCPKGTVAIRLLRGRELLRKRLARRGVALSAGALAAALSPQAAGAAPAPLVTAAVRGALALAAGQAVAAAGLADRALRAMFVTRLKVGAALALGLGVLAAGVGLAAREVLAAKPPENKPEDGPKPTARGTNGPQAEDKKPARLDAHGDPLPPDVAARIGTVRCRHGAEVSAVAFAPDGKAVASAGYDGTVHLWDAATGQELRRWDDDFLGALGANVVLGVAFAPDGKTLAAARLNRPPALWDVATGKELRQFGGGQFRALWVAFSPDGQTLALGARRGDPVIVLAEAATGKELRQLAGLAEGARGAAFTPDGKALAAAGADNTVRLWDVATGKELRQLTGHQAAVAHVAFAADGKTLASGGADRTIRLWDVATGKELRALTVPEKEEQDAPLVLLAPDGKTLISGNCNVVRFWDVARGEETRRFRPDPKNEWVSALALSPDGKALASGGNDHAVRLWDVATGKPLVEPAAPRRGLRWVAFAPDGKAVATGGWDDVIRLWDAATGKELRELPHRGPSAFTPDGKTLVSGGWDDGQVRVWDVATGKELRRFQAHAGTTYGLALSPDGKAVATCGNSTVRLWDLATGKQLHDLGKQSYVFRVAFSPDGKVLASVHQDYTLRLWDVAAGKQLHHLTGHRSAVGGFTFAPDGKTLASSSGDRTIRFWDVATGREVRCLTGHGDTLGALAFSADGRTLAYGSQHEKAVRLFEVRTGRERRQFYGHQGQITGAAFAADGTRLATASEDATVLVWDLTGRLRDGQSAALTAEELDALWNDLANDEADKAYRVMCTLARAPRQAVALARKHLQPVPAADARRVAELLRDLDGEEFAVRDAAARELEKLGEAAEPHLRKALEAKLPLEAHRRLEGLLERLEGQEPLRRSRLLEVLEWLDAREARQLLESLAKGAPGAWLTEEAKAALGRLAKR